jgi:hypothetical protein
MSTYKSPGEMDKDPLADSVEGLDGCCSAASKVRLASSRSGQFFLH